MILGGLLCVDLRSVASTPNSRQSLIDRPPITSAGLWPEAAPPGCPFPKSSQFEGVEFTGRHKEYTGADTWYPSWAADGNLYSGFTDGGVPKADGKGFVHCVANNPSYRTGNARIEGDNPLDLKVVPLGAHKASGMPYGGRYPSAYLVHDGIWYYGTYCLDFHKAPWDVLGPFCGFRLSRDFGETWEDSPCSPVKPLFPEAVKPYDPAVLDPATPLPPRGKSVTDEVLKNLPKIKIGAPHFVDFGKNMEHSPDGKAYLLAHGAVRPEAANGWSAGDQVYLVRVKPSPETINDATAYEFFAGRNAKEQPVWSSDFKKMKPLLEWNDHMGIVTATYVPGLQKYLMCVTDGHGPNKDTLGPYDTYILEANVLTGPWKRVAYMKAFGTQAYFVTIPSKFIHADGRTMWISYSHGWSEKVPSPTGSKYAMCLQEVRLVAQGNPTGVKPYDLVVGTVPDWPENVARKATATSSSQTSRGPASGAINGRVGGLFLTDAPDEWATPSEGEGAWLRLTWDTPQTVNRIWLFDRPDRRVQVLEAELLFSDGSSITSGELPNEADQGRQIDFPERTITWLEVRITKGVIDLKRAPRIGLSEVAVFTARRPDTR